MNGNGPKPRAVLAALAAVVAVLCLALPAAASAANFTFSVSTASGTGEGEVMCTIEEPGEEEVEVWEGETCEGTYPANTKVIFEAPLPETGSEFVGFENGTGSATVCTGKITCSFKLTANSSVSAIFDLEEFTLTINKQGTGKGTVKCSTEGPFVPCAAKYPYETELTLLAEAGDESEFIGWSGEACEFFEEECELMVEEDTTVTATFNLQPQLKIEKQGTGAEASVVRCYAEAGPEPCKPRYPRDTDLTLLAEPEAESEFAGWSGACSGVEEECELTIEEDTTVTATFNSTAEHTLTVERTGKGSGTVTSSPGSISCGSVCSDDFLAGTEVTLAATPASGSTFEGFSGACTGTGPCTVTMSKSRNVTATFDLTPKPKFTLTVTKSGAGTGKVRCDGGACASSYRMGTTVTLAATAASGSAFAGWSGGGCSGSGTCVVTIEANTAITATFDKAAAPPPLPGTAKAAGTAKVSGNNALMMLTCTGGGPCKGTLKLTAKVRQGQKRKKLIIGKASFQIAAGKSKTVKVKITSGQIRKQLGKGHTVTARLKGSGIKPRTIKLKGPKRISRR